LRQADLLEAIEGRFDLVVSNPPYVLRDETLPPELAHEPRRALIDDGQTTAVAEGAQRVLDGSLVLEIHEERAATVSDALRTLGYDDVTVTKDLAGRDRVVEGRWTR
jgi:release factor glutamine methyltransferase